MTVQTMPRPIADVVAGFLAAQAQGNRHPWASDGQERCDSHTTFLAHYHQAVREGQKVTADNLAYAPLQIARQHQEAPGFRTAWLQWQQVGPTLEGDAG